MSLLSEVLKGAEKVDVEEINHKVPELKKTVDILKTEGLSYVDNIYLKYSNKSKQTQRQLLLKKGLEAEQQLISLNQKATFVSTKQLIKTDHELSKNIKELESIDFALSVVLKILNLDKLVNAFDEDLGRKNYLNCAKTLQELDTNLNAIPPDERLDVISELESIVKCKKEEIQNQLKNVITDFVSIQENNKDNSTVIKIKKDCPKIEEALQAAFFENEDIYVLHNMARNLWEFFLVPIVENTVVFDESENEHFISFTITIKKAGEKSSYKTVFNNLKIFMEFLIEHLDKNVTENITFLEYVGNDIRDNLSELIIKSCLRDTIPNNAEELQQYKVVIDDTNALESTLLAAKIFTSETESILEYANKVDILFINKKCQKYLETATEIMKRDLHDMKEVGKPYDSFDPDPVEFTRCSISKNVTKLLELCENILEEALSASPECAGRLFCTVQNIIHKYTTFVPEFHSKYLQSLPQQIALFHNNCLYIAHVLNEWYKTYCLKLRKTLSCCDFFNEAKQLPLVALEVFSKYVEQQVKQIDEIMNGAELNGNTIDKLNSKTEKCVRQCLRQQELLKTVWHKVLSYSVYNKNVGVIVDALCKFLIKSVIKFEDISAEVATNLSEVIKIILTRAPKLFTNSEEIPIFVPSWYKLNELHFLLDASLTSIDDRWADGKGPLALQFERGELKQIIKALFQNTDRRAAMLAKI